MALNIATFGAIKAVTVANNAGKAALKKLFENLKKLYDQNKQAQELIASRKGMIPVAAGGKTPENILQANTDSITPEDIVRVAAQLASFADPIGTSDVTAAYTYAKCPALKI